MVRADGLEEALRQAEALMEGERHVTPNLANLSALLWESLEEINWAGFYLAVEGELLLGPFQGRPACIRIPLGKGVCGAAASRRETLVVPDVHEFPGHIACDGRSRSEAAVPLLSGEGELLGVLDVDSPVPNRFTPLEAAFLECAAGLAVRACDWESWRA